MAIARPISAAAPARRDLPGPDVKGVLIARRVLPSFKSKSTTEIRSVVDVELMTSAGEQTLP